MNRYNSKFWNDRSLTKEYAAQIKAGEDARIAQEKRLKEIKDKQQFAVKVFGFKPQGYQMFDDKNKAESFLKDQIQDAKNALKSMKDMGLNIQKEQAIVDKYIKETKVVTKESIYK